MRQWTIDAFAAAPFKGNPACVLEPFEAFPDAGWMQALAAENAQAETAFLRRTADPARFDLRWFTPALEVPLCGHATLASAHALFAELGVDAEAITFDTASGPLIVRRVGGLYEMDFPASIPHQIVPPDGLVEALGVTPKEVWAAQFLVCVLEDEAAVKAVQPDLVALKDISSQATQGRGNVAVCALGEGDYDVVSRFFAPGSGIPEDAATGSMHCILSPLYAEKLGRKTLRFHQAYPGRGADLECEHRGERVLLRGRAVTVAESVLRL
jgi:predicted PhzF superfamily epimerase YddE/YHI9